ncbi:alpha/beta hydrolase [Bdellovibrio sp. HCB-162]|uniref:alpha/beta hydrolase n=1 Tax=Bdellovibrio sp. HCB-162 TaxID=3394234 RepID=UPI0039BD3DBF
MKITVTFTSQGRMLEGLLFLPESSQGVVPGLLFEGSMTGATNQIAELIAREVSLQGFVCLVMDHSFYGDDEGAAQPWESPSKRLEDIKAALRFLIEHAAVDSEKIVGVGVSVGAEYMAQVCRETNYCKGLIMLQGPFDDSQNVTRDLEIPSIVIDETHLDSAVDEVVLWTRTLFNGSLPEQKNEPQNIDWSRSDK